MQISAQQFRAVTGCFAARLWSSDWTPGSSRKAGAKQRLCRGNGKVTLSSSLAAKWWSCLLLLANITTSTLPMILGPVLVMNIAEMIVSTQPTFAGSLVGVGLPMTTQHSDGMGPEITRNALFSNIKRLMLLVSGDIESNPGPGTAQNNEQVLKLMNNTGYKDEKNLCFVNTSLQLLYSIPEVRDFFKGRKYRTEYKGRLPVSDEIYRIFKTEKAWLNLTIAFSSKHPSIEIWNTSRYNWLRYYVDI